MACQFWLDKRIEGGDYQCPWCPRTLKSKLSNSIKNPGKSFVTCNKEFGGCGLFSFLDVQPNEEFNPSKKKTFNKRTKIDDSIGVGGAIPQGTNVIGPISNAPTATEMRLAELATKIDEMQTQLAAIRDYLEK